MTTRPEHDRLTLLASIDEITAANALLGGTVARLLEFVVPAFADVATLDTISPNGELTRVGSRVQGPGREHLERGLMQRRPVPEAPVGLPRALSSGEGQLIERMAEEHLRAIAADQADYELLRALELRSMVDVPLVARGRIVGALACGVGPSGRDYGPGDLRFAEVLSARLALALDNAGLSAAVSGLEQRLEATLRNLAEAVLVRDASGPLVFANDAAARLLGLASAEDVLAMSSEQLMALYDVFDEHGHEISLDQLPSAAATRGESARPLLVRNVIRSTGEERWLLHKATPVFDADGALSMVISVIEDLTEVKRAELAQRLLAEAGQALASSLDYEQALKQVAELVVPGLADCCCVALRGPDGGLELVALVHSDLEKRELAVRVGQEVAARLGERGETAAVMAHRRARVIAHIDEALLAQAGIEGALLGHLRDLQLRSLIVIPLAAPAQPPVGVLTVAMAESGRRFDQADVGLLQELGHRVATAVETARLYRERSLIASTLQRSLLPPELPDIPDFRLAGAYQAAGEQNDVGGDFYDAFEVPGGWMVLVGDVAGRGAEAAALTSLSRYTLRTAGRLLGDPIAAFEQLNDALREREGLSLVSVCCVLLRADGEAVRAEVVLAGHPPAYRVRSGTPSPVGVFAPFLGAYERGGWAAVTTDLAAGDRLVLYTDGVIDAVGEEERFGEDRLIATLREGHSAEDTVARIERAVGEFALGPQVDDMAVIVVERTGRG
ncbi:MAG TPA: SpoIIE family protein phosphatase [Solirubrobacteraceae bacterium]|nr:SpoIIE family protein phosphatase [Solirubrobacteraceae bacterium]